MNIENHKLIQRASTELYLTQMELEFGMREKGIQRFRKNLEKKVQAGNEDETSYGGRIIGTQLEGFATGIETYVEKNKIHAGTASAAVPLIEALGDYRRAAYLTLKAVVAGITKTLPQTSICVRIGQFVEDEIRCSALKDYDRQSYRNMLKAVKKKGDYNKKRQTEMYIGRVTELDWATWDESTRFKVGLALFECLRVAIPEFIEIEVLTEGSGKVIKTTKYIKATESTMKWIEDNKEYVEGLNPIYEPMVVPPVPWEEGMVMGGGYISNHVTPLKLVKVRSAATLEEIKQAKMEGVYRALNAAQDTAWRIRKPILELLQYAYKQQLSLGKLNFSPESELPEQPDKELFPEDHKAWRSAARGIYEDNLALANNKLNIWKNLNTAERYQRFEKVYMPWQLDFRGRVYCVTSLSPQGEDYIKGLIEFSEGKALGTQEAADWLFVHVANLFGVDKVPFPERVQWVKDHMPQLLAVADDPMADRFWEEADKPWQALAACYELKGYAKHGLNYKSRMAVALDGSCSGLQNLGMALECEVTGKSVNLLPADAPADIYREVADKVIAKLKAACDYDKVQAGDLTIMDVAIERCRKIYFEGNDKASEKKWQNMWNKVQAPKTNRNKEDDITAQIRKEYSLVSESHAWLEFGVTRTTAKRSVMTFPYGSEEFGFKEQVMEDTLRPALKKVLKKHNAKVTQELPAGVWLFKDDGHSAAVVMAKFLFESVRATVLKAAEAMTWMQECARLVAKQQRPVKWKTPLGFPVTQDYRKLKTKRIDTVLNGSRYSLTIAESTLDMDINKSANSISPNVVHSLDSSHLMLTTANAADEGFDSFALIHDSFGTYAADTQRFFAIIRESFLELYSEVDVFRDLGKQFKEQLPPEAHLPLLPIYGNLNREDILDSLYAFA